MTPASSAADVVVALQAVHDPAELPKVQQRLAPGEPAIGMRMRDLFDVAAAHADVALDEVDRLLDEPAYEARLAAMCILDFQARRRARDAERAARCELYLHRHDRITTWDMVDRAAPRVVGGHVVATGDAAVLDELAASGAPLRRRTAITAPLFFVRAGTDDDVAVGFDLAGRLAADPEPVVSNAVGIFVKHAGERDPAGQRRFLDAHGGVMARPALRLAIAKLDDATRRRYLA